MCSNQVGPNKKEAPLKNACANYLAFKMTANLMENENQIISSLMENESEWDGKSLSECQGLINVSTLLLVGEPFKHKFLCIQFHSNIPDLNNKNEEKPEQENWVKSTVI